MDPRTKQSHRISASGTKRNSNANELFKQLYRLKAVEAINSGHELFNSDPDAARNKVSHLIHEIEASTVAGDEVIGTLLEDLKGQVTEALSKPEFYRKVRFF